MSSSSQEKRTEVLGELRQFHGLSESFFRAAAARTGMTVTDMQLLDILKSIGATSAGQLADLIGLTGGAITGMLNRLDEAGLVRRERDPNDGRRLLVRLAGDKSERPEIGPIFASLEKGWDELLSHYTDEQVAFLLEFLKHSNSLSRQEIARLREAPENEREVFSAPLGDLESARLVVSCGISRLSLRTDSSIHELYQARFEGPVPGVKMKEGVVSIHYPRRLLGLGEKQGTAEIVLNTAIPWQIVIQGGATEVEARLRDLDLARLRVIGGFSTVHLDLGSPSGIIPIHVTGGASEITIVRPAGIATRVYLKGRVSALVIDEQTWSGVGNNAQMHSPGFDLTAPCYDIEVISYVDKLTITSG